MAGAPSGWTGHYTNEPPIRFTRVTSSKKQLLVLEITFIMLM
jgi:hypothetical protein